MLSLTLIFAPILTQPFAHKYVDTPPETMFMAKIKEINHE